MNIYLLRKKGLIDRHCCGLLRLYVHFLFMPSEKYGATSVSLPFNQPGSTADAGHFNPSNPRRTEATLLVLNLKKEYSGGKQCMLGLK
ncbi:unnamed protein product [Citrullus colocynthis]|uniref:Uncharacterized protein n=1 Tax=Citrullus colocynthis TaxID=252529 RepID=A0ABP0Y8M7_9ROSI